MKTKFRVKNIILYRNDLIAFKVCANIEKQLSNCPGILAQLGEHLPYKQRVIGSSPIGPICAGVAELADAQDLKSCGTNLPYRFDSGRRHYSF
jgi:hypothetical protein